MGGREHKDHAQMKGTYCRFHSQLCFIFPCVKVESKLLGLVFKSSLRPFSVDFLWVLHHHTVVHPMYNCHICLHFIFAPMCSPVPEVPSSSLLHLITCLIQALTWPTSCRVMFFRFPAVTCSGCNIKKKKFCSQLWCALQCLGFLLDVSSVWFTYRQFTSVLTCSLWAHCTD